ncbi:uncharacterized protein EV420DRAFT_1571583 [Desarmillaria tabescens]|uniref:Uncharacterized protein n=1 Tax=Armillaria tabescens TaxID=1929756 RepID=A0AA39MT31_ARMTA|nr:uncharacterized protein EV420DRAFT_1571583 [Desarmillaria tabescens]KAK0446071.1 hypothetical protein EV420DRAFT_1571583 [Desarmillaria tabescens]
MRYGQPWRTHFVISVDQQRVFDAFNNEEIASPDEIAKQLRELKNAAFKHARGTRQSRLLIWQQKRQSEQEERRQKEEVSLLFYKCLVEHGAIKHSDLPSQPTYTCPVCKGPEELVKCLNCGLLCCVVSSCPSHSIDGLKYCINHQDTRYCRSRIGTGNDAKLRTCPVKQCKTWTCEKDWEWCLGRPLLAMSSSTVEIDDGPSSLVQTCILRANSSALAPCSSHSAWTKYASKKCWSKKVLETWMGSCKMVVCPDCGTPGEACCTGCSWICALCASKEISPIWNCLRCLDALCNDCDIINRCFGCGKSEWCLLCQNEFGKGEKGYNNPSSTIKGSKPRGVARNKSAGDVPKFHWTCHTCHSALCRTCSLNQRLSILCEYCDKEFCGDCIFYATCGLCHKNIARCIDCSLGDNNSSCCSAPTFS